MILLWNVFGYLALAVVAVGLPVRLALAWERRQHRRLIAGLRRQARRTPAYTRDERHDLSEE